MKPEQLYERLKKFGVGCALACRLLPKTRSNLFYSNQLTRSSGSSGANYIEAWEATGGQDFIYRLKVCRKELKESIHWIDLILATNVSAPAIFRDLRKEAEELVKILSKSISTAEKNKMINEKMKKRQINSK